MKDKKGFTIIELLAVLLVLGMLMVFAYPAIFKTEKAAEEVLNKAEERNLKDAAKLVAIDLDDYMSPIYNCKNGSWIKEYCHTIKDSEDNDVWYYVVFPVNLLIEKGYFTDNSNHCTKNNSLIRINKQSQGYEVDLSNIKCE